MLTVQLHVEKALNDDKLGKRGKSSVFERWKMHVWMSSSSMLFLFTVSVLLFYFRVIIAFSRQ